MQAFQLDNADNANQLDKLTIRKRKQHTVTLAQYEFKLRFHYEARHKITMYSLRSPTAQDVYVRNTLVRTN